MRAARTAAAAGPRRARPPLLQSPSRPNRAAQAQNWGRMAHADGHGRAQNGPGRLACPGGVRAAWDSARGPGDGLRHTPSARRGPKSVSCATGGPWQVLLQSLAGAACASGLGAGAAGQAPAARRGATQGTVLASGWLGRGRLSTFPRQDVSAALLVATCGRARRRPFAHPPASSRMCAHLAALSCRTGIMLLLGHAQLFQVGFASVVSARGDLLPVWRSHSRCPGPVCSSITGAAFLWLWQMQRPLEQGLSSTPAYRRCMRVDQILHS
jgi:hypothetical protein